MQRKVRAHRAGKSSPDLGRESQGRLSGILLKSCLKETRTQQGGVDDGLSRGKCMNKRRYQGMKKLGVSRELPGVQNS